MRRQIVLGNWKMNGEFRTVKSLCEALNRVTADVKHVDLAVCVPFPYLSYVRENIDHHIALGAQNVSAYDNGAYTGEVSTSMLNDLDCRYVLVGHSERRALCAENNMDVALKAKQAVKAGLTAVVCVGETLAERQAGKLESILGAQVEILFKFLSKKELEHIIIAYEPVWAIGTGLAASSTQVEAVHQFIRRTVTKSDEALAKRLRIVYGGSLKPSNAREILSLKNVDGGLIGGASLKGKDFGEIINQTQSKTC